MTNEQHAEDKEANRLASETSPYLLQHAYNPVDWYPWGPEALAVARAEDKPIFLSIGYSACHWCHVMAHESFEDVEVAAYMNDHFVNIKVDREERPDVDNIYMEAVQALRGQGGWPLSAFLTPTGLPFFGGTYFPPTDRQGMPAFRRVLESVVEAWTTQRDQIEESAVQIREQLGRQLAGAPDRAQFDKSMLKMAADGIESTYDEKNGGFGQAPKFPQPMNIEFLLRQAVGASNDALLKKVRRTLDKMANGGIYDQLGGGFHRYSTDERWLVPHFEKMLYDNAQLARLYLDAWLVTAEPAYRRVAEETLDYIVRELKSPEGGFYSAQDADSEGEEGKFYVWSLDELQTALDGADARKVALYFDVTAGGNFEGVNILHVSRDIDVVAAMARVKEEDIVAAVARAKPLLLAARNARIHPGLDDKQLVSWNGMAMRAFAQAAMALDRADYLDIAAKNAEFLLDKLVVDGRLLHTYRAGQAKVNGFLEDYANLIDGLLALYEASGTARWFTAAHDLATAMLDHFTDADGGGLFDTSDDHEELLRRPKDATDNAVPSANSVAADVLLRLSALTQDAKWEEAATTWLNAMHAAAQQYPTAFGRLLCAYDFALNTPKEMAIVGPSTDAAFRQMRALLAQTYVPNRVIALFDPATGDPPADLGLLEGRTMVNGQTTAYVCENFVCLSPATSVEQLQTLLAKAEDDLWVTV